MSGTLTTATDASRRPFPPVTCVGFATVRARPFLQLRRLRRPLGFAVIRPCPHRVAVAVAVPLPRARSRWTGERSGRCPTSMAILRASRPSGQVSRKSHSLQQSQRERLAAQGRECRDGPVLEPFEQPVLLPRWCPGHSRMTGSCCLGPAGANDAAVARAFGMAPARRSSRRSCGPRTGAPMCTPEPCTRQPSRICCSSRGLAVASDGPYQVRSRPDTRTVRTPGNASGPSSQVKR
jgi:hypothetical protein